MLAIAGDIRDRATAQKVVAAAKERFGRVALSSLGVVIHVDGGEVAGVS